MYQESDSRQINAYFLPQRMKINICSVCEKKEGEQGEDKIKQKPGKRNRGRQSGDDVSGRGNRDAAQRVS